MSGRYARIPGGYWRDFAGKVSLAAHGLYAIGRSFCADQRTDGVVEEQWLAGMCGGKLDKNAVAELVGAGWWEKVPAGYLDTRYLRDNVSREQAEARAVSTKRRVDRFRGRNTDGGNDDGNGGGNGRRNGVTDAVTQDNHDNHDSHDLARGSLGDPVARSATPLGIVESAYSRALGAAGAKFVGNPTEDVPHWRAAHAGILALSRPGEVLRSAAERLAAAYVSDRRSRSPKWFAEWLQKRAAASPAHLTGGYAPPSTNHENITDEEIAAYGG